MSKKKANNEGSIVKRKDGRYMGRYTLNNKRYAIYGTTYDKVRIKLTEALANIDKLIKITGFVFLLISSPPLLLIIYHSNYSARTYVPSSEGTNYL